jgi:methionyl-tRNA formyltransferase
VAGVVFFGCTDTGWDCCQALLEQGVALAAVVTMPRDFRISWAPAPVRNVRHRDLAPLAHRHGLPVLDGTDASRRPDFREAIARLEPDLLVVVGWFHMISRSLRAQARLGAVGVHASLLPKYRGGAPLVWAMIHGVRETGVTLFHFDDGVDDGDIVAQARIAIGPDDTIAEVVERANAMAVGLVSRHVPAVLAGTAPRTAQDPGEATVVPQRSPDDGRIEWGRLAAREVHDWVRAQTRPYPGAFTYDGDRRLTIWRTALAALPSPTSLRSGAVKITDGRVSVACADGHLVEVIEVQWEGTPPLVGAACVAAFAAAAAGSTDPVILA